MQWTGGQWVPTTAQVPMYKPRCGYGTRGCALFHGYRWRVHSRQVIQPRKFSVCCEHSLENRNLEPFIFLNGCRWLEPKRRWSFILNTGVTTVAVILLTFFFLKKSRSAIDEVVETSFRCFFLNSVLRLENELGDLTTETFVLIMIKFHTVSHRIKWSGDILYPKRHRTTSWWTQWSLLIIQYHYWVIEVKSGNFGEHRDLCAAVELPFFFF